MIRHLETLKRVMEGDYDDASPREREKAVRELIQVCAVAAGAAAFQPLPLLDIALISPIQIALVQGIGRIHGHRLDKKSVLEILSTFGASLLAQGAILAAAKIVPILGWAIAMSVAYALTWAVGEVSDHYFRTGRGASKRELKEMFDQIYKAKRGERESAVASSSTLKERLEQLKEARLAGLVDDAEFARKKEEILSSL